jgi:hypothetical protein
LTLHRGRRGRDRLATLLEGFDVGVGEAAPDGVVFPLELQRLPDLGGTGRLVAEGEILPDEGAEGSAARPVRDLLTS